MSEPQPPSRKYEHSTRRDLAPTQWRGLKLLLIILGLVFLAIIIAAFLVATGEITLR